MKINSFNKILTMAILLTVLTPLTFLIAERPSKRLSEFPADRLTVKIASDLLYITQCRNGLKRVLDFMKAEKKIFSRKKNKGMPFTRAEGEVIQDTWKSMLDYLMALESVRLHHGQYLVSGNNDNRYSSFKCYYSAFVAQYRFALEFLELTEKDPVFLKILNEPVPETGLGQGSYSDFKFRYLNILTAVHYAAMELQMKVYIRGGKDKPSGTARSDSKKIRSFGKGKGIVMTAANAITSIKESTTSIFFPVQSGVAELMGDTKILRWNSSLISQSQISGILKKMKPGDILLERREWYLSNIGLPGFWPHAALYIGTKNEREKYFDSPDIAQWVISEGEASGSFEELLKKKFRSAYSDFIKMDGEGHAHRVMEAMSEGVLFTTFEHSASCDSLAVLRPRLSKTEKARAIMTAFSYYKTPYDFNFDFTTESSIVCTELVYRSYEPYGEYNGIDFRIRKMLGRPVLPANDIVKQFDDEYNTPEQKTDLVLFLDGHEFKDKAVFSSVEEFRKSCTRPKWHIFVQELEKKGSK